MVPASPGTGLAWDLSRVIFEGIISVTNSSIPTTPTNVTFKVGDGTLTLSWPADYIGWRLLSQTNSLEVGLSTNWVEVPGSSATNSVIITNNPGVPVEFYRLVYP